MWNRSRNTNSSRRLACRSAAMEVLEQRRLFSAASHIVIQPDSIFLRSADSTSTAIQGYTPSQIASAYGFTGVTFSTSTGTVAGQGAGPDHRDHRCQ